MHSKYEVGTNVNRGRNLLPPSKGPLDLPSQRLKELNSYRCKGAALVLVLCAVVLITVIALAFMASITVERQAAASYANGSEVRMLAESVVNLVIGQIRQASEQTNVVWTSQPGLLRTFDVNGNALNAYKLYSSLEFSQAASSFNPTNDVPIDWTERPAEYVDINRPVVTGVAGVTDTNFPILDPRGVGKIEGFSINSSPYGVAMPVAWLYLLRDGTITNSSGLADGDPPVARVAFWADDETCKLNVNTASEGFFWDMPRTCTPDDARMAMNQPAQREFQGYPGHPATTSLSPVFWEYFHEKSPSLVREPQTGNTNTFPEVLYSMLPRTLGGGSRGGTVPYTSVTAKLGLKNDRLFTSVDELVFLAATNGPIRQTNAFIDHDVIEQTRFFLTAHSRAPELNLFNMPRVTIWPIHRQTGSMYRTPFDNLIAFASTINSNSYYFTREDSKSPTSDFSGRNEELYRYLQGLTDGPIPGFGGSFADKYGPDRDQILTEVFDYIRCVNLRDSSTGNTNFVTFTSKGNGINSDGTVKTARGMGQVVPITPNSSQPGSGTRGFGRFQTLNRALLVIAASSNLVNTNTVPASTNATITQAALFFETFNPAQGPAMTCPDYTITVNTTQPFRVVSGTTATFSFSGINVVNGSPSVAGGRNTGGYDGFVANSTSSSIGFKTDLTGVNSYPFISQSFTNTWTSSNQTITVEGGEIKAEIRGPNGGLPLQTITFQFPAFSAPMPQPDKILQPAGQGYDYRFGTNTSGQNADRTGNRNKPVELNPTDVNQPRGIMTKHWIGTNDIARSLEATGVQGDIRLLAAQTNVTAAFEKVANYGNSAYHAYSALSTLQAEFPWGQGIYQNSSVNNQRFGRLVAGSIAEGIGPSAYNAISYVPPGIDGVTNAAGAGDWDTAMSAYASGPLINKPDDGDLSGGGYPPYWFTDYFTPLGETFSSPSRQMPSAVMFGSLPTGVKANQPWQTLLFCPNPASHYGAGSHIHQGETSPKDHLLLDLFQMPVVEPYAISEPFSTAGKVNMNYQIIPFTGIERKTALHGILRSTKITAIDNNTVRYKLYTAYTGTGANSKLLRYPIDVSNTLISYFDTRFATNGIFKSASEICDIPLLPAPTSSNAVPTTVTPATLDSFWENNKQTGDNLRENPYTRIYPRLTTRSNTYTVHIWVQTLKKLPTTQPGQWVDGRDKVTGEFRGSFIIERYLNPAESNIPDIATLSESDNLNRFYRYRVISSKQFNP